MPLLPFDKFRIDTSLTSVEVHNALAAAVEPRKRFRFGRGRCPFEGELGIDSFTLTRIISYRNSFIPSIRGRIITTSSGSTVEGRCRFIPLCCGS